MAYPEITGTIEPEEEPWQAAFARKLAKIRSGLNKIDLRHPFLGLAENAALAASGIHGLPPPKDVGGLMNPESRASDGGLGELVIGEAPKSFEQWGRGDAPYTMGVEGIAGRLPSLKPGRAQQAVDIASMMPVDALAFGSKPLVLGAVRKAEDVVPKKVAETLAERLTQFGVSPREKAFTEKVSKWLTRSAGKDDPILRGLKPIEDTAPHEPADPFKYLRGMGTGDYTPPQARAAQMSRYRGLPPASENSMQELVDTYMRGTFVTGADPEDVARWKQYGLPEGIGEEFGQTDEQLRKLIDLLPEDAHIASSWKSSAYGTPIEEAALKNQLGSAYSWTSDIPDAEFQRMDVPALFKRRQDLITESMREYEKVQRGKIVMNFPDKGLEWQKLESKHLKREKDLMSHCIDQYGSQVDCGELEVFSLRDKENKPAVTLGIHKPDTLRTLNDNDPDWDRLYDRLTDAEYDMLKEANLGDDWTGSVLHLKQILPSARFVKVIRGAEPRREVLQIKGEANRVPEKYHDEIKAFLEKEGVEYKEVRDWQKIEEAYEGTRPDLEFELPQPPLIEDFLQAANAAVHRPRVGLTAAQERLWRARPVGARADDQYEHLMNALDGEVAANRLDEMEANIIAREYRWRLELP